MTVYLQDTDLTLHHGDCLEVLRTLPDRSVHMCATSPPFYGLRDYGTGEWEGGDPECDHVARRTVNADHKHDRSVASKAGVAGHVPNAWGGGDHHDESAPDKACKCGARRVDQQIGLEETPDQWVERLVAVFREVRRVLRDDGTLWVEIGDSYCSQGGDGRAGKAYTGQPHVDQVSKDTRVRAGGGVKPKDLLGQPWLLAFALRADGWWLRSEIIWARPNPMPESVTDRPTKSHSTVFLLSKRPRYFYDADAIRLGYEDGWKGRTDGGSGSNGRIGGPGGFQKLARVPAQPQSETLDGSDGESPRGPDGRRVTAVTGRENSEQHRDGERWPNPSGANARSVWQIPTEPTPFAHFATWPRKLVARMILAGTSERGCCPECGAPWVRDVEREKENEITKAVVGKHATVLAQDDHKTSRPLPRSRNDGQEFGWKTTTLGWSPSCECGTAPGEYESVDGYQTLPPVPCTVLDPFAGSGTTLLVARQHGRHSIGIELNPAYCELVRDRTSQQSLLADVS